MNDTSWLSATVRNRPSPGPTGAERLLVVSVGTGMADPSVKRGALAAKEGIEAEDEAMAMIAACGLTPGASGMSEPSLWRVFSQRLKREALNTCPEDTRPRFWSKVLRPTEPK